jgi:hypothetical protein
MSESVVVVQRNGGGYVTGARVTLGFSGILSGGNTDTVYTDSNGEASISHSNTGKATVYVNGKNMGTMKTSGRKLVFI